MQEFSFISGLTPIVHNTHEHSDRSARAAFIISLLSDGEPYISALLGKHPIESFDAQDRRAILEIQRIESAGAGFDVNFGNASSRGVSLWKNPHILQLIRHTDMISGPGYTQVSFRDSKTSLSLTIDLPENGKKATTSLVAAFGDNRISDFIFLSDSVILADDSILDIDPVGPNFKNIRQVVEPIERPNIETYLSLFLSFFDNITPVFNGLPAKFSSTPEHAVPTIILEKVAADKALYLRVISTVDSISEDAFANLGLTRSASLANDGRVIVRDIIQPDIDNEIQQLEKLVLASAPSRQAKKDVFVDKNFFIIPAETAGPFLLSHLPKILHDFRLLGSDKLREYKVSAATPKLNLKLSSGIDFLEGSADVTVGDDRMSISELLDQYSRNRYVTLSDGNRAILDEKYIGRLQRIFNRKNSKGKVKISFFDLPEVEDLIQDKVKGDFATRTRKTFEGFNKLKTARTPKLPVKAKLRDYQKQGVKWIKYLYDNKLGGCLADDMGLGKTLQTISVLSLIYPGAEKPSLIVMPRSLLFNWEKEFEKFAPQIRVSTYYGADRDLEKALDTDVMITTYAVARNDIEKLRDTQFEYVILDESQNIKNVSSQTAQAVTLLNASHRLALSGTPMENNLTELYSLFRFLNPTMFGTYEDFNSAYTYPIQKSGDKDATESLRRKIFPFILRRLKRDVLKELPDRIDRTLYVEMSDKQKKFYEDRRLAFREEINRSIQKSGVAKSQFIMFQALNELRRIASVPESLSDGRIHSPKIDELIDSLSDSVGNGHKTVVFFNYIAGLDIVASRLSDMGVDFETMTGSTSAAARKKIVERFQSDPQCMVLLMTLKVGGVGLNLTAADTVFIFEPWWNKAAEEQAINRLHRIGQKASVVSCSLITEGSIEEKILMLQQQKKELFDNLISDDSASTKHLSEEDINFILS